RLPLPSRDAPFLQLCGALVVRAWDAETERAWHHAQRQERSLARHRWELAERQRRRSVHDLRAPLVGVKGSTDMLLRGLGGCLGPGVTRYRERIASAGERQRSLLEETFPKPRMATRGPRTLVQWLSLFLDVLRQWAPRRQLVLSVADTPADCTLEA